MLEENQVEGCTVKTDGDLFELHTWIKQEAGGSADG